MLTLHIGLPKTATTFLQTNVFGRTPGLALVHRRRGDEKKRICNMLRTFVGAPPERARKVRGRLVGHLETYGAEVAAGGRRVIVSNENVAISSRSFWVGGGPSPGKVARRLGVLRDRLGPEMLPLKVVIGIRRQDQWLASRYAESSKNFPDFSQADFDRRLEEIAAAPTLAGPLGWLDHDHVRRVFVRALGRENLFLLPLERLAADEAGVLADLGGFLGVEVTLPKTHAAAEAAPRKNALGAGANAWTLKRDGASLRLSPEQQAAVLGRFEASNAALLAAGGPGLASATGAAFAEGPTRAT